MIISFSGCVGVSRKTLAQVLSHDGSILFFSIFPGFSTYGFVLFISLILLELITARAILDTIAGSPSSVPLLVSLDTSLLLQLQFALAWSFWSDEALAQD